MCSIAAVGGTNQHLKLYLSLDRGYSQGDAAQVISLVLAVSIVGRLLMGWLADRMPRKYVMLIIYLLVAGAIPLLLIRTSWSMYVFATIFGLGLGGEYLIIPLMAGELFGVGVLGRVMGIVLTADGVAEATAPTLVGYLRRPLRQLRRGLYSARRRGAGRRRSRSRFFRNVGRAPHAQALSPETRFQPCASSTARSSSAVPGATSSR